MKDTHNISLRNNIFIWVRDKWQNLLAKNELQDDKSLYSQGASSMTAAIFATLVEEEFDVQIRPSEIAEKLTINEIADFIYVRVNA